MTDLDPRSPNRPTVGEEVIVAVHQAGGRTTYFPDQVVAVSTAEAVELVMLRQEFIVRAQHGVVQSVSDDEIALQFQPQGFMPELFDVGHVRISARPAIDMAITILHQQMEAGNTDVDDVVKRLRAMGVGSK